MQFEKNSTRTYQLPYPETTAPDRGLVTLPALRPHELVGPRPGEQEAVRLLIAARGMSGAHAAGMVFEAMVRLARAVGGRIGDPS